MESTRILLQARNTPAPVFRPTIRGKSLQGRADRRGQSRRQETRHCGLGGGNGKDHPNGKPPPEVASARGLDIFHTASRYPDAVPGSKAPSQIITENQAEDALRIATGTVEYLNGILEAHANLVRNPENE